MAQIPIEWIGGDAWRLPSGKALSEFALQAGFLAPLLLRAETTQAASCTARVSPEIRDTL